MLKKYWIFGIAVSSIYTKDVDILLEFKGAYFLSADTAFKNTYGQGSALYGPELTFRLYKNLYGWASVDFFNKKGSTLRNGSSTCANITTCCHILECGGYPTHVTFMPLALGLKCLVPFSNESQWLTGDWYVGLGIEPTYLQSSSPARRANKKWGIGGIAKVGTYFNLPHDFFIDVFFDYSFVWVRHKKLTVNLSGYIIGAGIGYRFN